MAGGSLTSSSHHQRVDLARPPAAVPPGHRSQHPTTRSAIHRASTTRAPRRSLATKPRCSNNLRRVLPAARSPSALGLPARMTAPFGLPPSSRRCNPSDSRPPATGGRESVRSQRMESLGAGQESQPHRGSDEAEPADGEGGTRPLPGSAEAHADQCCTSHADAKDGEDGDQNLEKFAHVLSLHLRTCRHQSTCLGHVPEDPIPAPARVGERGNDGPCGGSSTG